MYCADCGSKLHFATGKNMTPEQDCYRCARYKSNTGDCSMHFIREETLKRFVLRRIFDVTAMFFEDIMRFEEAVQKQRFEEAEKEAKSVGRKSPKPKSGLRNLTGFSSVSMRTIYPAQSLTNGFEVIRRV